MPGMTLQGYRRLALLSIASLSSLACGREAGLEGPALAVARSAPGDTARIDPLAEIAAYRPLDGERLDVVAVFFEDGSPQSRREVLRDADGMINHGLFQTWHANGQIAEEGHYFKGRKHGVYTLSSDSGLKQSEVEYRQGVRDGLSLTWGDGGMLRERTRYVAGVLDGLHETWIGGKPLSAGTYRKGLEEGEWTYWYSGLDQVKELGSFAAGKRHGRTLEFDPEAHKLAERTYVHGELEGLQLEWYPNGAKRSETSYAGGKPQGKQTQWYENGQVRAEGELVEGQRQGPWAYYDADGTVNAEWTGVYESGQRVSG